MKVAILAIGHLFGRVRVVEVMAMGLGVEDVALGIPFPYDEIALPAQNLGTDAPARFLTSVLALKYGRRGKTGGPAVGRKDALERPLPPGQPTPYSFATSAAKVARKAG